jgi:hypothetical protein
MIYNIIGAGLAGSFIANEFKKLNINFRIFDSNELFASSKISENLFSDTWLKDLPYIKTSLNYLFDNYEIEKKIFKTNKGIQEVYHLPINKILINDYINKKVTSINEDGLFCNNDFFQGINIVCAGYFSKELIKINNLKSLTGHGLLFESNDNNKSLTEIMKHYRPFIHEKIIKWYDGRIWYGDSTTILHENYLKRKNQYIEETIQRAKNNGFKGAYKIYFGARPFIDNENKKFGLYKKISKNNYVFTGGWKDSLVIYPYLLSKFIKDIN